MPSLYGYDVEDMVVNRPRRVLNDEEHIALDNTAAIVPFAQQEIVHAFLRGVDENLKEYMQESTGELFTGVISSILDAVERVDTTLRKPLEEAIGPEVNRVLLRLFNRWEKETVNYWGPVIEIVGSLPKDELADMAEALINLTKFRRRITPERETVGVRLMSLSSLKAMASFG
jgi:hypothetical protein